MLAEFVFTRGELDLSFGNFFTNLSHFHISMIWSGLRMASVEETCFLSHFYRDGRFVAQTFTTTTTTPLPKSACLLIFCISTLFTDCLVCGQN